jgi:hypothetical protein
LSQHCPLQNECLWTTSTSYAWLLNSQTLFHAHFMNKSFLL